jgi:deoxyadenosine/deoxycytidine kinase
VEPGPPIVVIAGSIATGKTALLDALSRGLSLTPYRERWEENPWFEADLRNPLVSQLWFLLAAGSDHARMSGNGGVQERCIHENAQVFARELLEAGDLRTLEDVYEHLDGGLPDPTLLVHLTASPEELLRRVRRRGRAQESTVTVEYLRRLDARYRQFIGDWSRCPVVEIDSEAIDVRSNEGIRHALQQVSEERL